MTNVNYQNPSSTDVILQSVQISGGSPPTNAEAIIIGTDPTGTVGCSTFHLVAAASTNANNIKNAAGTLYAVTVFNTAVYPVYVKIFNKASTPVPGTDTPVRTFGIQAGTSMLFSLPQGMALATGIGIAITLIVADSDATATQASDCVVDVDYK